MVQRKTGAGSPQQRDAGKGAGNVPFLRQRVGDAAPKPRSSEGASTGRSAKSTAGGGAGQLSEKD